MNQIGNAGLSLLRPSWTQCDLHAYRHLHTVKGRSKNHFIRTHGFRTMEDLRYAKKEIQKMKIMLNKAGDKVIRVEGVRGEADRILLYMTTIVANQKKKTNLHFNSAQFIKRYSE